MGALSKLLKDEMNYAKLAFLSEEIGREVGKSLTEIIKKEPIETKEARPIHSHIINHILNETRWYEIKLEKDIVTWQLRLRENYDLNYCFEPSHSTYMTLTRGGTLSEDTVPNRDIDAIYVMCETAGVTVELEIWR